jgi:hypothetical protein
LVEEMQHPRMPMAAMRTGLLGWRGVDCLWFPPRGDA